jgi:hypothetical protein
VHGFVRVERDDDGATGAGGATTVEGVDRPVRGNGNANRSEESDLGA